MDFRFQVVPGYIHGRLPKIWGSHCFACLRLPQSSFKTPGRCQTSNPKRSPWISRTRWFLLDFVGNGKRKCMEKSTKNPNGECRGHHFSKSYGRGNFTRKVAVRRETQPAFPFKNITNSGLRILIVSTWAGRELSAAKELPYCHQQN